MPFIKTISPKEATGRVKEIYDEWGFWAHGPPANIFSIRPNLLEVMVTGATQAHARSPTPLPPQLRQIIAVTVSQANSCPFCFDSHSTMLQTLGFARSQYQKLIKQTESGKMDDITRELSEFSRKATTNIAKISPADAKKLRDALGDEGNFVEAVWTIAFFNFINRVVNSLGVTLPFFVKSAKSAFSVGLGRLHPVTIMLRRVLTLDKEIPSPNPEEILRDLDSLYRVKLSFTQAPLFYGALMRRPIQMKMWSNMASAHLTDGVLPLEVKMLIASVTSKMDGYDWLFEQSIQWLKERGMVATATDPAEPLRSIHLYRGLEELLRLAQDISQHSYKITEKRIEELRGEGLKDEEILEAVSVTSLFNGESRLYRCLA